MVRTFRTGKISSVRSEKFEGKGNERLSFQNSSRSVYFLRAALFCSPRRGRPWVLFEGDPAEHLITWERAALMVRAMQGQTALYAECERERGANVMRELAGRESSKMKGKP